MRYGDSFGLTWGRTTAVVVDLLNPLCASVPAPEQAAWRDLELGMFTYDDLPVFKPG